MPHFLHDADDSVLGLGGLSLRHSLLANPALLFGSFLFGAIGLAVFIYGKRLALWKPMVIGIALMVYPYFISRTWMMYAIGAALCAALYWLRD